MGAGGVVKMQGCPVGSILNDAGESPHPHHPSLLAIAVQVLSGSASWVQVVAVARVPVAAAAVVLLLEEEGYDSPVQSSRKSMLSWYVVDAKLVQYVLTATFPLPMRESSSPMSLMRPVT